MTDADAPLDAVPTTPAEAWRVLERYGPAVTPHIVRDAIVVLLDARRGTSRER
jgi:hypothetical protein